MELSNEHRLTEVEARAASNTKRIDSIERRQDDLDKIVASIAVMASEQEHIKQDVATIKKDVKNIVDKPAKRWDAIVDKIIWMVLAALVAYLLAKIGL